VVEVVLVALPVATGDAPLAAHSDTWSDRQIVAEGQQSPDYAARLRKLFQGASTQALISRRDALGAAAEIEQLWAALWAAGCTNNDVMFAQDETSLGICSPTNDETPRAA
jgi:hypothetical protein